MSDYQTIGGYGIDFLGINPALGDPVALGALVALRGDSTSTATDFDALDRTGNGHTFRQTIAASKPTIVSLPELNNQLAFRADGTDDHLISIDPATFWEFISDGTGFTVFQVHVPRNAAAAQFMSNITTGTTAGIQIGSNISSLSYNIFNDAGAFSVTVTETSFFTIGFPISFLASYQEGAAPTEWQLSTGGKHALQAGNSALAPGTATPAATMNLFRRANGTQHALIDMAEWAMWNRLVTDEERLRLAYYTLNRYRTT